MLDGPACAGGFVVRDAGPSDVGRVFEIYSQALGALDEVGREWLEALVRSRSRRKRVVVVELDGSVVGFATVFKRGEVAFLDSIAVDEDVRSRGVGGLLLDVIEGGLNRRVLSPSRLALRTGT
ncbi:MAG: GNAT family N-acetyltransferase [Zestosphaera sp.]